MTRIGLLDYESLRSFVYWAIPKLRKFPWLEGRFFNCPIRCSDRLMILWMCFFLLSFASVQASPVREANWEYEFFRDSDGVITNGWKATTPIPGSPLKIALYYTRITQNYPPLTSGTALNEYAFMLQWKRALPGNASLALWGGVLSNEVRRYTPWAIFYDKDFSQRTHFSFSTVSRSINTVLANQAGLYKTTASLSLQHWLDKTSYLKILADDSFYSDTNMEQKYQFVYSKQLSKRFSLSAIYMYHSAAFFRFGYYAVPQQEHVYMVSPSYTIPLAKGALTLSTMSGLFARTASDLINYYELDADLKIGKFAANYHHLNDGAYNQTTYRLEYRTNW